MVEFASIDDCWNRIGIGGDGSCERLPQYVHCRNCPVYAQASRTLLDRMPVTYQDAQTALSRGQAVANGRSVAASAGQTVQVLVFRLHAEWLAIAVSALEEVAPVRAVHGLPHRRGGALLGVTNIRGSLLGCVSLKSVLNIDQAVLTQDRAVARMLVFSTPGASVVTLVDEVDGIYALDPSALSPVPATLGLASVNHTQGWGPCGKRDVGLLDTDAVRSALERGMQ